MKVRTARPPRRTKDTTKASIRIARPVPHVILPPSDARTTVITSIEDVLSLPPEELAALELQLNRAGWSSDCASWIRERAQEHVWSKQELICDSIVQNRRTAVPSCHGPGKSFIASRIVAWWLDIHDPGEAFVVSSASVGRQVRTVLWREINRVKAKAGLPGRTNQTEWYMEVRHPNGEINEEIVGFGMKPDDYNPTAFQGIHQRYVLVIFDEACGMAAPLWDAADSLLSNVNSRFLAIGNPDDPGTEFCEVCKPGSGWNVIPISAFDTPNLTGEPIPDYMIELLTSKLWVEEKKAKWGEKNPIYISKVLGQFPDTTTNGLIPLSWIKAAQLRTLHADGVSELGVDMGAGGDATAVCHRRGQVYRIVREDNDPDTMKQTGKIIADMKALRAKVVKIDKIGIGQGVVDRGKELKHPFIGVNVGEKCVIEEDADEDDERYNFANLKMQLYMHLRGLFERGEIDIDPEDDDLAADLANVRVERTSKGKLKIADKKKNAKGKTVESPNRGEALMLAAAPKELLEEVSGGLVW